MKKKTFTAFLLLLISCTAAAQRFVDTSHVWNTVECINFGPCFSVGIQVGGDTTVGIYTYKKLVRNTNGFGCTSQMNAFFGTPEAVREDTVAKRVYAMSSGIEALLYDFSLNKGDTFNGNYFGCIYQMAIDSTDSVTLLNGEKRKRIIAYSAGYDIWIEGIGSQSGPYQTAEIRCGADLYPTLNCFKENGIVKYQHSSFNTCCYNTIGINEHGKKADCKLYPNPFNRHAVLMVQNRLLLNGTLEIYDSQGRLAKSMSGLYGTEFSISANNLPAGFYYYKLSAEGSEVAAGKMMVY